LKLHNGLIPEDEKMHVGYKFIFAIISQIIFFLVILVIIIWFIINVKKKETSAKEILDKRFASGEISRKEYSLIMKKINGEKK
jgi:uncharacterized membrane protein